MAIEVTEEQVTAAFMKTIENMNTPVNEELLQDLKCICGLEPYEEFFRIMAGEMWKYLNDR